MERKPVTVLIVEDHEIARLGLRFTLEQYPHIKIVGEAADGSQAVSLAGTISPEVILMDIGLADIDGIEASRQIKATQPNVRIIMLTSHDHRETVLAAFAAGADAYCLKTVTAEQLILAIDAVTAGAKWLDPGVAQHVLEVCMQSTAVPVTSSGAQKQSSYAISPRELEVLTLLVRGLTNQKIADELYLSHETVKTHMRHIMEKLVVSDRTQAALKAVKQGIVS